MRATFTRLLPLVALLGLGASRPPNVPFVVHAIDNGASETASVFDVDGDRRLDIVSGEFWYQAPAWTPHRFRELNFTSNYVDAFSDLPLDVDGDGRTDLVTVSWFAKRIAWYRNPGAAGPGRAGAMWADAEVDSGFPIEFAILADLDNDGQVRELLPQFGDVKAPLAWYEVKNGSWVKHVAAPASFGHGIGAGDVNGDGRTDILTPKGWLEAPADPRSGAWTHHADWADEQQLGFLHAIDLTGDGRNEILTMAGHDYGVHYYERGSDGTWARRVIDDSWSQAHASTLVDLNRDGRLDLVTGKRYMAHNGKDPGEKEPLGLYWYQFRPDAKGRPEWIRHVIHYGGQVGGGMQIPAVDIDGDGDVDLVTAGKSGLYLLENRTAKSKPPAR
jgi:hypothetical protein